MSKVANMLNMLKILKDNQIHSIEELAQNLEVTPRMVRRYKEELEQTGIYIKSYTGRYGGYQIYKNDSFLKLDDLIKEKIYIIMKKAIANKNKVKINFYSINSGITERIIHPAELFNYLDSWYIAAFCELRNEIRLFKLDDIKEYYVLEEKYN